MFGKIYVIGLQLPKAFKKMTKRNCIDVIKKMIPKIFKGKL